MNATNELKFNSQICTSVEQSKRLLELGLNPETADMKHFLTTEMIIHFFIIGNVSHTNGIKNL